MCDTKVLSSHSSSTRDSRLLYHLRFPKPQIHISYLQYFHSATKLNFLKFHFSIKMICMICTCNEK